MAEQAYQVFVHIPVQAQAADLALYRVVLALHQRRVYLLLLGEAGVLGCKEYSSTSPTAQGPALWELVLTSEPLLAAPRAACEVFVPASDFLLVPDEYWDARRSADYARLQLDGLLQPGALASEPVPGEPARLLFLCPPDLRLLLDRCLGSYRLRHVAAALIDSSRQLTAAAALLLLWQDDHLLVLARAGGRLLLCNRYPCHQASDTLYFTQAVRQHCLSDAGADLAIFIMGEWVPDSSDSRELRRLLPAAQLPHALRPVVPVAGPYWKYAFLCAS
ncbi:MAG: hypothetical protein OHK0039_31960 [Bacteroidia bacterium]